MLFSHALPETQAALALSIFLATFIYEDGATLLAATASASGALDPRLGILTTFLGIWMGDMGLYGLGSGFGRRTAESRWLRKYLTPESLAKAEGWFARHGSLALVMSRAIPGSRLPLYVAAGALRLPVRLFAKTTAACSAVWVCAIFAIWRFIPKVSSGHPNLLPWLITALVLFAPWLLTRSARSLGGWIRNREKSSRLPKGQFMCTATSMREATSTNDWAPVLLVQPLVASSRLARSRDPKEESMVKVSVLSLAMATIGGACDLEVVGLCAH